MKVVIVTNSTNYEPRAEKVGRFLEKRGHEVLWLESDFSHSEKKKRQNHLPGHRYINTVPYKKNLSISRLYSQYDFSQKVFRVLKKEYVDLLYVLAPANSLAPIAAKLKKKYATTKVVLDIIDLWPESLPLKGLKGFWPVQYWRRLRDDHLKEADLIITECQYYQEFLHLEEGNAGAKPMVTMYWPKGKEAKECVKFQADDGDADGKLHIAYLGSINHIIDMDLIMTVLETVNHKKKVKMHVIGDGENRDVFLERLKKKGIETEYHGSIYDEEEKQRILSKCSFGLNMMKEQVCVGLTMKSIDYFCYGVPMINNIKGDTWQLIEQYGIGVNCDREAPGKCGEKVIEVAEKIQERRQIIRDIYRKLFTEQAMEQVLEKNLLPLLEEES